MSTNWVTRNCSDENGKKERLVKVEEGIYVKSFSHGEELVFVKNKDRCKTALRRYEPSFSKSGKVEKFKRESNFSGLMVG